MGRPPSIDKSGMRRGQRKDICGYVLVALMLAVGLVAFSAPLPANTQLCELVGNDQGAITETTGSLVLELRN